MTQFSRHICTCVAVIFILSKACGQNWTKQSDTKADSLFAVYTWEAHDDYHSAAGEIVLTKKGRFFYKAFYPLNSHEYSEGAYRIKKDTLILTSDFQADNMKVAINYVDTTTSDSAYIRLTFPQNQNGDTLYNAYYFINGDTSVNGHYDPMLPYNRELLTSIKSIKVAFYETNCGSMWMPINQADKFIKVTLLTDKNLNERSYKAIDWKFKIVKNELIRLDQKNNDASNKILSKAEPTNKY